MKHAIIVDDDHGIQEMLELILKRAGYQTTVYSNSDDLFAMQFEEPDIFIIDRQLNLNDGLDVCRFLKSRKNEVTPVIISSASGYAKINAIEAGADDFLEKPFKIKTLLGMIERLTA